MLNGGRKVQDAKTIFRLLSAQHPNAGPELEFNNAFQLLVATVLSAQSTDKRVNQVTRVLFRSFSTSALLHTANLREIERIIRPVGLHKNKARALTEIARTIEDEYDGTVPSKMENLLRLPGVGRKTANVVLGHGLKLHTFPVDRHVLRVCNRLGLSEHTKPHSIELELTSVLDPNSWLQMSDSLIIHGRRICKPRPHCEKCQLTLCCRYFDEQA